MRPIAPLALTVQIASHTEHIDSLLRSLVSLPALAPYIHEIRSRYKRLSDMSAYLQGAPPIPPEAAVPAVPAEVASSSGRRSRKAPPVPPVPATSSAVHTTVPTSSRGQDPDLMDAARSSKKRKTVPPNVANGKSAPIGRTGRAPPTANGAVPASGKRRDDGFAYGAEAPGQPAVWSSDRASLGNGARAFGSERGAPRNRISKGGRDGDDDHDQQRYCFCNNVSYGDMIGCDDDECEREWFHLGCVGLSKPPQGTWYCDACLERRANQARNKAKRGGASNSTAKPTRMPVSYTHLRAHET